MVIADMQALLAACHLHDAGLLLIEDGGQRAILEVALPESDPIGGLIRLTIHGERLESVGAARPAEIIRLDIAATDDGQWVVHVCAVPDDDPTDFIERIWRARDVELVRRRGGPADDS